MERNATGVGVASCFHSFVSPFASLISSFALWFQSSHAFWCRSLITAFHSARSKVRRRHAFCDVAPQVTHCTHSAPPPQISGIGRPPQNGHGKSEQAADADAFGVVKHSEILGGRGIALFVRGILPERFIRPPHHSELAPLSERVIAFTCGLYVFLQRGVLPGSPCNLMWLWVVMPFRPRFRDSIARAVSALQHQPRTRRWTTTPKGHWTILGFRLWLRCLVAHDFWFLFWGLVISSFLPQNPDIKTLHPIRKSRVQRLWLLIIHRSAAMSFTHSKTVPPPAWPRGIEQARCWHR
jgi:hypothetical protein